MNGTIITEDIRAVQSKLNMVRVNKSKRGKAVALQDNPSSEEEQDEDSPQDHRGASHIRTAENMLSAVGLIVLF